MYQIISEKPISDILVMCYCGYEYKNDKQNGIGLFIDRLIIIGYLHSTYL